MSERCLVRQGGKVMIYCNCSYISTGELLLSNREYNDYDKWKLPTPSCIAVCNFSFMTCLELYSGSLR